MRSWGIERRIMTLMAAMFSFTLTVVMISTPAQAAEPPVDVNFNQLVFNYTPGVGYVNIIGNGTQNGDVVLWKNLITVDGVTVDAAVTTQIASAVVDQYGTAGTGSAGDFKVRVNPTVANGFAAFTFAFYKSGTYGTPSAAELVLQNVQVTAKDIDLNQFNTFVGARGYTVASPTALTVTKTPLNPNIWPSDLRFQGPSGGGVDSGVHQAVVSFSEITNSQIVMGKAGTGASLFALTWKFASFKDSSTTTSQGQPVTVTYDLNGGTGTTPSSVSGVFGEIKGKVAEQGTSFERPGYTFLGWTTEPGGGGNAYTPGNDLTLPANNTTLYANWAGSYTITYDGNGSTGGTEPADGTFVTGGPAYTIAGNTGSLSRPGYTFGGWNTQADGNGVNYTPGDSYSQNANLTLYAIWTPDITATLKLKVMSTGTGALSSGPISEIYDGVEVELSADGGSTWNYRAMQVTDETGYVDFGTVDPNVTYQVRLKAPCDDRPVETKTDLAVTTGDFDFTRTLAATVPCAPVLSYSLARDSLLWTEPNDGGSRIRYYTYHYKQPSGSQWGIYSRFWPATPLSQAVPFVTYGTDTPTCPTSASAPYSPSPYDTPPQCSRIWGAPTVGTTYDWRIAARNALSTQSVTQPKGVGWGIWSNTVTTDRQS